MLDQHGRTQAERERAIQCQRARAEALWKALGEQMGKDGLRLITQATENMTGAEMRAVLRQVQ